MNETTPNGSSEQETASKTEGVVETTATPEEQAKQQTESSKEQGKAEEGISSEDFEKQLRQDPAKASSNEDKGAKESHESQMLQASTRVAKLAREKSISKEEAALELKDDGLISPSEANYLFKRNFEGGTNDAQVNQGVDKNTLKSEIRAEDKLASVAIASKLTIAQSKSLIDDYRSLATRNSPEEAAEFALHRAGISNRQAAADAYKQGANETKTAHKNAGTSPTTPKPKSVSESGVADNLDDYMDQRKEEMEELQEMQDQGQA